MMKKTFVVVVLLVVVLCCGRIIVDTGIYSFHSLNIRSVEKLANSGHTKLSEKDQQHYEKAVVAKKSFVENNCTAAILYNLGFSVSGQFIRMILVILICALFYLSVAVAFRGCKSIIRDLQKTGQFH